MFLADNEFANISGKAIRHGFFGRRGGVSTGIYDSLNCGPGSDDNAEHVSENRQRTMKALDMPSTALVTLHQIHSDICLTVSKPWEKNPQADATVTDVPGLALGVLTADCAPVLFFGRKTTGAPVIGAAHAGWKGAVGGILENTVKAMRGLGAAEICAAVGPCLGPQSFEVTGEFLQPFLAQDPENRRFFVEDDGICFNLPAYVAHRLDLAGVTALPGQAADTYAAEDDFFSYRRSTHRNEPDYGRQLSAIVISG